MPSQPSLFEALTGRPRHREHDDTHGLEAAGRGLDCDLVDKVGGRRVYRSCPGPESLHVCLHRQAQVVTGRGSAKRFSCPYHAWTYDNTGKLVGLPGREGFPQSTVQSDGLTELPAAEFAGFLWLALDPLDTGATLDVAAHLGELADELDSWGIGRWSPLGEKVLDFPINWKLAVDTFTENYHFATVHRQTFATIARATALCSIPTDRITG